MQAGDITGLVLAGGRGSRMGGVDKGLQLFHGTPLALNALTRLGLQKGGVVGERMVNANRNLSTYEGFGAPVWPDTQGDYAGPLAGFLAGLARCRTPFMLTVPCDSPRFPLDLALRLAQAFEDRETDIAMVATPEGNGRLRAQPVFCLLKVGLLDSLRDYIHGGGRKIDHWTAQHRTALIPFDLPGDDPLAFANANTLDELHALENP